MAFPLSVCGLFEESAKPENRGYADNGGPEFKRVAALVAVRWWRWTRCFVPQSRPRGLIRFATRLPSPVG